MTARWPMALRLTAAAALLMTVAGCRTATETNAGEEVAWETKSRSVLPRDPELAHMNVPVPDEGSLDAEFRAAAVTLLLQATESTNPLLVANAVEALQSAPEQLDSVLRRTLGAENRGVRFVSLMTIGRLEMRALAHLAEPHRTDESASVRAAAIYALRRCGRPADPTPLAVMVMAEDPEVRGNAAYVIGEMGDPSALGLLREAVLQHHPRVPAARERIVELQMAEAMVKLGADRELEVIRAAMFAPEDQGEITVLACQMAGRLQDQIYMGALLDKAVRTGRHQEAPEIRLAAIEALARMDPARAPGPLVLEYVTSDRYELRVQAVSTLGLVGDPAYKQIAAEMMSDPNALVQVAAAGAVLRLTSPGVGTAARVDTN